MTGIDSSIDRLYIERVVKKAEGIVNLTQIQNLIDEIAPREGLNQYTLGEIHGALNSAGYAMTERSVYRQLKGLCVRKNPGGRYGDPEVALILGWNMRRDRYSSHAQFMLAEGTRLYEVALTRFK